MKKLTLLFMILILLNLVSSCGLKGPLYFPIKEIDKKLKSMILSKNKLLIDRNKNTSCID
ncbi:MAG: LPS translocon maturation chaperone LptM [Arsenophonus sp. ET-YP4-MAG3]